MQHDVVGGEPAALDDLNAFGQFHRGVRLEGKCASTARFSVALMADQAAISSSVRKQPSHRPVSGFIRHTLLHGEGTSAPGRVSGFMIPSRRAPVRLSKPATELSKVLTPASSEA